MSKDALVDPLARIGVTPALERAVWKACTSVPGLIPEAIDVNGGEGGSPVSIAFTLRGWSPSLHACTIQFAGTSGPAATGLEHAVLDLLAPFVEDQRRRADDAFAHGIGMPADVSPASPASAHLHADATHLAMAIHAAVTTRMQGPDWSGDGDWDGDPMDDPTIVDGIIKDAASTVSLSHNGNARAYDGGPVIASSGCMAVQRTDADGRTVRCVGMGSQSLPAGSDRALVGITASGATRCTLPRDGIPDTIVAVLPGRLFAEAFEFPGFLRDHLGPRRMGDAEERNDSVFITLEPLDAAFADIAGRTPRAALAHLRALIAAGSG